MGKEFQDIMYGKNKYLETLFNLINDGIMTLSEDFKILAINDTFSTWLRKTKSKLINSNIIFEVCQ